MSQASLVTLINHKVFAAFSVFQWYFQLCSYAHSQLRSVAAVGGDPPEWERGVQGCVEALRQLCGIGSAPP